MKRLLILTQWFDPEPTLKGKTFAKKLAEAGFDVQVVTGFPNYPQGKLYDGYNLKLVQHEYFDEIKITRVALYPSHNRSKFERVMTYLSFAISSAIYCLCFAPKSDVIYCYNPPMTVGFVGVLIKFFRKVPIVADVQDLWPDTITASGMVQTGFLHEVANAITKFAYKHFDDIIVQSDGFKSTLLERQIPKRKLHVVHNWAPSPIVSKERVGVKITEDQETENVFHLMYAGNIGEAQSIETLLDATKLLKDWGYPIKVTIIGGGVKASKITEQAHIEGMKCISVRSSVPMDEIGSHLIQADALLVILKKHPLFEITIPSKTQAYMAAGKPIVMAVEGDASEIIKTANCGVCSRAEDAEDLAKQIMRLQNLPKNELLQLGANAKKYYDDNLCIDIGVQKFASILKGHGSRRTGQTT